MHILFLTDNFPPEVNAPASRTYEHAREWVKAGHRVTVVTCAPNFPTGRLLGGYRNRLFQRETLDGIEVVRVWSYITANDGFLRRTLDYMSFMATATLTAPFLARPDIIVATSPQFFTAVAGFMVSRLRRRQYVFELRDIWPESIRAVGAMKNGRVLDMLERLELFLYRRARKVVAVTEAFRHNLISRGIDGAKIEVVRNGADLERFRPREKDTELLRQLGLSDRFVAGYVGTHGMAHALGTLLDAAHLLQQRGNDRVHILFLGEGAAKAGLVSRAASLGLTNVTFLDSVPKAEVARYWSLLDVSIIHLKQADVFTTVIPSKLFECMAMGIPVLHGVLGESADIVESTGCGLLFPPEDAEALCSRLVELSNDEALCRKLAQNGAASASRFDRRAMAASMLAVLESASRPA